jgi:hypothetical protein
MVPEHAEIAMNPAFSGYCRHRGASKGQNYLREGEDFPPSGNHPARNRYGGPEPRTAVFP